MNRVLPIAVIALLSVPSAVNGQTPPPAGYPGTVTLARTGITDATGAANVIAPRPAHAYTVLARASGGSVADLEAQAHSTG